MVKPRVIDFRKAKVEDLPALVGMLADDPLGQEREDASLPLVDSYRKIFQEIDKDPNQELIVASLEDRVIGMMQLSFIPYLTYRGSWRCLVEGVRIHRDYRGQHLGSQFFDWVIDRARERSCHMIQLTSDKQRPDAIRFYEKLGFKGTHEGMKMWLS
ncbi:GNAT family N-acetyltransferase [Pseudobacteriovorax antillogorgiicola]|nr:GNAT family N-acetyltransferase [Pseudobacteriovorax antillogorgiicola]